ncbi:hypothetical protein QLS71_007395 [Mariniflexile litorale]|uniref:Uncharacterized protein n=1 Tax=Mariniflexile litorale TaxID=3045158 RepID=A0AAU7ELG2_9FLAO|nr:hypothetical protein [Mariniflexile sp. KMM 9835]MDQ8211228.1 hypothetical protein [Mariniflexile sp. KMM 9835]
MANNTGQKFGGRTKGTANKHSNEIRQKFQSLIEDNLEVLQADLNKLKPFERVKVIIELGKFVMPTLKAIEIQNDDIKPERPKFVFINRRDPKIIDAAEKP